LSMSTLIEGRWKTAGAFFRDLGIAAGFVVVVVLLLSVVPALLGVKPGSSLASLTPKTGFELAVFLVLATMGGGFCEEIIFRGYLLRQFQGWTGSWAAGIILQGVAFGLSHGYYSKIIMGIIMLHGILLGVLAYWRKSLLPGMLAHGLQDVGGGITAFLS
jgi:membrane protease YdiL (CAAX protease family)